jgi:glycine/D-amino acid oxidase-like deaminating enzyme
MKIAVVGSGVVGLTTALELQSEYRNAKISIIAEKFYKETTSYVAAGIFRPGNMIHSDDLTYELVAHQEHHSADRRNK